IREVGNTIVPAIIKNLSNIPTIVRAIAKNMKPLTIVPTIFIMPIRIFDNSKLNTFEYKKYINNHIATLSTIDGIFLTGKSGVIAAIKPAPVETINVDLKSIVIIMHKNIITSKKSGFIPNNRGGVI